MFCKNAAKILIILELMLKVITIRDSYLHVLESELIQSKSALFTAEKPLFQRLQNQRWFRVDFFLNSADQPWIFQFWIDLSQKIRADQPWNSADVFHVLWIST